MAIGDMKVEIKIQDIDEVRDILNKAKAIIESDEKNPLPFVGKIPPKCSEEQRKSIVKAVREAVTDLNILLGLAANNNIKVVFKEFDVTHIGDATSRTMVDVDLWRNY